MPSVVLRTTSPPGSRSSTPVKAKDINRGRRENRLLPALQLCPDLLEYLFLLGATLEHDIHHRRRTILSYAQTSHDWRNSALATKALWVQLADFDDMSWTWNEEMLRRSYPLPVEMGLSTFPPRDVDVVSAELEHLDRVRTYRLGFMDDTWGVLQEKLQRPAKHIEYLSLAHVPLMTSRTRSDWFILPRALFSDSAPNLRRIKLDGCLVDFRAPVLRSLTSLTVFNLNIHHKLAPTPFDWLRLLATMPHLTELFLKDAISSSFPSHSTSSSRTPSTIIDKRIRLPLLAALHLEAGLSAVSALLLRLVLPPTCEMSLSCSEAQPGMEMEGVLDAFVRGLGGLLQDNISRTEHTRSHSASSPSSSTHFAFPLLIYARGSTLSICTDDRVLGHAKDLSSSFSSSNTESTFKSMNFYLDLHAPHSGCWEPFLSPVLAALEDSTLSDVPHADTTLARRTHTACSLVSLITSIEILLPSAHPALVSFLRKATRLETLVNLPATLTKNLLSQLRMTHPTSPHSPTNSSAGVPAGCLSPDADTVPLPNLHTISFNDEKSTWGAPYTALVSFVRWRATAEAPLQRVFFRRCAVLEEKVRELEEMGVKVECDLEGLRWQNL